MLNKNKIQFAEALVKNIKNFLLSNKDTIFKYNKDITEDTYNTIMDDFTFVINYLDNYIETNRNLLMGNTIKKKGDVLVILSYNEPIIMSCIPILNALVAGNKVYVKPSSKSESFFKFLWSNESIKNITGDLLVIVSLKSKEEIEDFIKIVNSVHFFGSERIGRHIYEICARHFVEFIPEIETADPKVVNMSNEERSLIYEDSMNTIFSSISHNAQMCERICGVYVNSEVYNAYLLCIKDIINSTSFKSKVLKHIPDNFIYNEKLVEDLKRDIEKSGGIVTCGKIGSGFSLVEKPDYLSNLVSNGYFYPVLWIIPYTSTEEVLEMLKNRRYFLGINIVTDNKDFKETLIENTRFTRYTSNKSHEKVNPIEGWGGNWPSGSGGYKTWLEHFSVSFVVL